ncbi:uncharacterized protein EAF01_007642 [Botrytis porri]|uniref:uncharacterized protein n=1 Tax=Botrytis porri TaxID=87229 RepID=UPI001901A18A|nr:uncharacterized protein EAF01_007642 [Botrytis porri]KAF7900340.1 hypothetical protein EAF01_007642 [Botrytis porri]
MYDNYHILYHSSKFKSYPVKYCCCFSTSSLLFELSSFQIHTSLASATSHHQGFQSSKERLHTFYLITVTFQINAPSFCQTSTYKLIIQKTSKLTSHTSTSTSTFRFILNILQWPAEKENLPVESHLLEARLAQMETRSNKVIQVKPVFSFLAVVSSVS